MATGKNLKTGTLLLIFLLTLSCSAQEKKCADFKVGKFEYSAPKFSEWKVLRTDSTQTEISTKSGIEIQSLIKWNSDCEYVLTYKKVLNSRTDTRDIIGKKIEVEIIDIKSDRYTCKSKSDFINLELEMVRIK